MLHSTTALAVLLVMTAFVEGRYLKKGDIGVVVVESDKLPAWAIVLIAIGSLFAIPILVGLLYCIMFVVVFSCVCLSTMCCPAREDSNDQGSAQDERRFTEYKKDDPDTWPFVATTKDIKCYKHQKTMCDDCCMDFHVVNKLIRDKEYMVLFLYNDQERRYSMIQSTVEAYYNNSIGSEHNRESSPFTSLLVENMTSDDHVGAITLAAFMCYKYFGEATPILIAILDNAIRHYCSLNRAYLKGTHETEDNKAEYKGGLADDG